MECTTDNSNWFIKSCNCPHDRFDSSVVIRIAPRSVNVTVRGMVVHPLQKPRQRGPVPIYSDISGNRVRIVGDVVYEACKHGDCGWAAHPILGLRHMTDQRIEIPKPR